MASEGEAGPSKKRIKLEPNPIEDNSVRSLNRLFPKIDNLEYLRLNPAMHFFQRYDSFIQLFGSEIEAITAIDVLIRSKGSSWIKWLLNKTINLEKFELVLKSLAADEDLFLFQNYVRSDITHLTLGVDFAYAEGGFILSKFHNLKKLELISDPCISFETLSEVIHNNSGLESFSIRNRYTSNDAAKILRLYPFDKLMMLFGAKRPTQIKEFGYFPLYFGRSDWTTLQITRQPDHIVDAFDDSLKHLESLALSFYALNYFTDAAELLNRLARRCKNIKHLKLYQIPGTLDEISDAIRSFERVESVIKLICSILTATQLCL